MTPEEDLELHFQQGVMQFKLEKVVAQTVCIVIVSIILCVALGFCLEAWAKVRMHEASLKHNCPIVEVK